VFVELGSFRGTSYCAFCQAVKQLDVGTKCFAVDTWGGDAHSGSLDPLVFDLLKSHHDPRYGHFSTLLRKTFDEATADIADGSVDLLHIDGLHTYEAVRHDFETWLPKLSDRAIVLFHDTNVKALDFGVWKFWSEVIPHYPHFEFLHGYGLGVLAVGRDMPEGLRNLFEASPTEIDGIRNLFHRLGIAVEGEPLIAEKANRPDTFLNRYLFKTAPMFAMRLLFREGPGEFSKRLQKKIRGWISRAAKPADQQPG
jgi:hypothetical protein